VRPIAAELLDADLRRGAPGMMRLRVVNNALAFERVEVTLAPLFADPAAQAAVAVDAGGWAATYDASRQAWVLEGAALGAGEALHVTIRGAQPDIPAGEVLLPLVATAADGTARRATIALTVDPGGAPERDLLCPLDIRLEGALAVAVTRAAEPVRRTDLTLVVENRAGEPLVSGPWGPWPPTFTLVFVTADDPAREGALTTSRRLDDVELALEQGTGWRIVKRSPGPEWDLVAMPLGGRREVLGPRARIAVSIRGITTDFAPGPTPLDVRWHGFPGYADGARAFTLQKA
jgi:hypothetical protein